MQCARGVGRGVQEAGARYLGIVRHVDGGDRVGGTVGRRRSVRRAASAGAVLEWQVLESRAKQKQSQLERLLDSKARTWQNGRERRGAVWLRSCMCAQIALGLCGQAY